jgi:hypothetical protein
VRAFRRRPLAGSTLAAVLALTGAGLSGCAGAEGAAGERGTEVELPDVRGAEDLDDPYNGLLDADFYEDLTAYTGQEVTLLSEVAEVLSPRVFTVTSPEDAEVGPVLVVATQDAGDADPQAGTPLIVAATPVDSLDAAVVTEEFSLDVDPAQLAQWDDQAYLVAEVLAPAP